jgi:hypothetical protein
MKLRESDLSWQEIDDEIVVLDSANSEYLQLNATGAMLWRWLAEGADQAHLVTALTETFGIDRVTAEHDVMTFLGELDAKGLLSSIA